MSDAEALEVDVLIVGAGPAGLSAALRLAQLNQKHGKEISVMVIDKAGEPGHHQLSGAVMDPGALTELMPDWREKEAPVEFDVQEEFVWWLNEHDAVALPIPPQLDNHGNVIISLCKFTRWMCGLVEQKGVDLFHGFTGDDLIFENGTVVGVKLGDKGIGKDGKPRSNYEPGGEVRASVTILCEGTLGTLTRKATQTFDLGVGRNPQTYSTGVKEIWKLPPGRVRPGRVIHTTGWPLKDEYGGSWSYSMTGDRVSIGLVVGLDYANPNNDIHRLFQEFKTHPKIKAMLEGGEIVEYGAKTIPGGGHFAVPKLSVPGLLLAGDSAGFVNMLRLKGIHLAIKTGMLAAESAFENVANGMDLDRYERNVQDSWAGREMKEVRYYKQGFKFGNVAGMLNVGLMQVLGGWSPVGRTLKASHKYMKNRAGFGKPAAFKADDKLTYDKLKSVYFSDTHHDEDCPSHLLIKDPDICVNRCAGEFGNPCQNFCPAQVYEWVKSESSPDGSVQIGFGNCVHCKTCDIKDPYGNIEWVVPEGGGGPRWKEL